MFFYLSKISTVLVDPLFILLLFLFVLSSKIKHNSVIKRTVLTGLLLFSILSTNYVADKIFNLLEQAVPQTEINNSYDAVVVLAGMVNLNRSQLGKIEFSAAVDRILKGIELVRSGRVQKMIISGGTGLLMNQTKSEVVLLATFAIQQGVPEDRIIVDALSKNTYENALQTKKLVRYHKLKSLILVTSAFHMYRSVGVFTKIGLKVKPLPVDYRQKRTLSDFRNYLPTSSGVRTLSRAVREIVGIIIYGITDRAEY